MKHLSTITEAIFLTGRAEQREKHMQEFIRELTMEAAQIRLLSDMQQKEQKVKEFSIKTGINIDTIKLLTV